MLSSLFNFFIFMTNLGIYMGNGIHYVYTSSYNFTLCIYLEEQITNLYAFSLEYLRWYYDVKEEKKFFHSLNVNFSKKFSFIKRNLSAGIETGIGKSPSSEIVEEAFYLNIGTFLYWLDFYKVKDKLSFFIGVELEKGWTPLRVLDAPNPPIWISRYDINLGVILSFSILK
ncbi:MAG: hypothetical protein ABIM60_04805 [candidate division WOR-3 bacterium]